MTNLPRPLDGIRVFDFGLLLPGPYTTRLLADLGADVTAVRPPTGDPGEHLLPGLMSQLHDGKSVVHVDLKTASGRGEVHQLLQTADVLVEGFRPDVADRLGIGFGTVAALRPRIVYCSITGHGQDGPKRLAPAHDGNIEASGGAFAGLVAIGHEPITPYLPMADLAAAMHAAASITSALLGLARGTIDEAVHLDVSMEDVMAHVSTPRWGQYLLDRSAPDVDDLVAYSAGAGVFRTRDGRHVALAAIEDPFWYAACTVLRRPDLAVAPYHDHAGRSSAREHLRGIVATLVRERDSGELIAACEQAGVPASLVRTAAEVHADEHLVARRLFHEVGTDLHVAHPVRWNGERPSSGSAR